MKIYDLKISDAHWEIWAPDNPETGQIWMIQKAMQMMGWSLRFSSPCIGEEEKTAAMFYTAKHYCEWSPVPGEFDGSHPNPYVCASYPKNTSWIFDENPCLAILKAAKLAWEMRDEMYSM
jgi:hypothetical protein